VRGAYDARSLCHKVIVPHEGRLLSNGLGGSNEPFLNKPARFKMLSLNNAVRAGSDKRTLIRLHAALSNLKTSEQAFAALRDLVHIAREQIEARTAVMNRVVEQAEGGRSAVLASLKKLISASVHGETSALAVAVLFWIMGLSRKEEWTVQIHPINESGSSSNEVGDIDVYCDEELVITAEVKDKQFKLHDVEHALEKVKEAGHQTLHFIRGPHAHLSDTLEEQLMALAASNNVELLMLDLSNLMVDVVSFAPTSLSLRQVAEQVATYARTARVKTETLQQITEAFSGPAVL
jgi:hypothetical protein